MKKLLADRLVRYVLGGLLAVLLLAVSGCLYQGHRADKAEDAKVQAQAQAKTADAQAGLNAQVGEIMDRTHRTEVVVTTRAQEYAHAAATAPGASAPVPADVLGPWADGIDGLRLEAERARAGGSHAPGGS